MQLIGFRSYLTGRIQRVVIEDYISVDQVVVDCCSQVRDLGSSLIECYRCVSMYVIPQKCADFTLETLSK